MHIRLALLAFIPKMAITARDYLPTLQFGDAGAPKVLVMLAGFPDDETSSWGDVLLYLQTSKSFRDYRIMCCCLPDYEKGSVGKAKKPWGYTIDECVALLKSTIDKHVPNSRQKVTLVLHDWGSLVGQLYENRFPERVDRCVLLDVGQGLGPGKAFPLLGPATPYAIILLYQLWWASAYVVSQLVWAALGELLFALYGLLVPSFMWPTTLKSQDIPRPREEVGVALCYPYFQFWRAMFFSGAEQRRRMKPRKLSCPALFLFGADKNVMFHSARFIAELDTRSDGSRHVALDASHWMTRGPPGAACIREMEAFLL